MAVRIPSFIVLVAWLIAPAVRAQEPAAGLQVIKATWTTDQKITTDVTANVGKLVKDDRLDMKVDPVVFGVDPLPPNGSGRLSLTYKAGGRGKLVNFRGGDHVWLAPPGREPARAAARLPEVRKKHPTGLVVLAATYGADEMNKDVTDPLQSLVRDDSLTVPVGTDAFGNPAPSRPDKRLRVIYHDGQLTRETEARDGKTLQIGPKQLPVLARGGTVVDLRPKLAELRKARPEGIVVIDAQFGALHAFKDVTDVVRAAVSGDSLTLPVDTGTLGDPERAIPGKKLRMHYAVGDEIKFVEQAEGTVLQVGKRVTTIKAPDGSLLNVEKRVSELRKKHPTGLIVLQARYGTGNRWRDVTDLVQAAVSGDSLTVPIGSDAFGDPAPGAAGKQFQMAYLAGEEVKTVEQGEGDTLQIGPKRTAVAGIGGGVVSFENRIAELRKKHPTGLLVLQARYGEGNRWRDVTELLQSVASGDSLTVPVGDDALGNPAPGAAGKRFQMTYAVGDEVKTIEQGEGSVVQIGPKRTSMVALDGGLINLDARIAELRKDHPSGLLIVESKFGGGNQWIDVTQRVQDAVNGKTLTIKASTDAFGDPRPSQVDKTMVTTYFDGEKVVTVATSNGSTLKVDGKTVPTVGPGGVAMTVEQRLEAFRKVYGDGLIILDAQYGSGNRWGDVREFVQAAVVNDRVQATAGDASWGDPAPGSTKEVRITYWDGRRIRTITQAAGSKLDLRGVRPDALKSLAPLPAFAAQGQKLEHAFGGGGGKGTFALEEGPAGATLSPQGRLSWTPAADQVGRHDLRFSVSVDGKSYVSTARIEVVSRELAKEAGNDPAKLGSRLRLELGEGPVTFSPGLGWKTGLLLRPDELIIIGGDGTGVQRRAKLEKQYTHVAEREKYFVALSNEPKALDLLDKATLKPTRSIKLPYRALTDLAIHPTKALCYVAVEDPADGGPRYRVVVVNESTGDTREPENVIGRSLAIDPSGTRLYTGYNDIYKRGVRLFMNPDGRIWDTPTYGNIDILMVYTLGDGLRPRLDAYKANPGGNGSGLRLAPDGQRLTYLSHTGYPAGSGAIPAWDPTDLEKKPATYEVKGKAGTGRMSYHPTLPLVAVPAEGGVLLFHRETADEEKDRVQLPATAADGAKIEDVFFSPDGTNVLVLSRRGEAAQLYKAPLKLTPDEQATARRGVPLPRPQPQPQPRTPRPPRKAAPEA